MIEQVIAPANAILIEYVKNKMFKNVLTISPFEKIMRILKNFQTLFPDREKVQDFYWQHMLKCVYKNLISENIPFLPVLETTIQPRSGSEKQRIASLSWTALEYEGFTFKAFDNFESEEGNAESDFNNMLRSIGMRITTVSPEMKSSMKFAGVEISTLQPMHVIQFLSSFNSSSLDKCNIQTNKPIEKTSLKSKELLLQIAEYCLQDEEYFMSNIKKLPLMLTQDLTIHTLQEQKYLFVEETGLTYNLFPSKQSMFLHKSVSKLIQTKITDYQIKTDETCRQFTLQDLANLVRETCSLDSEVCAITAWCKDNPPAAWIQQFWNLFFSLLPSTYNQEEDIMKKELKVIQDLTVIPVVDSLKQNTFLVKPLNKKYLINMESFSQNECLHKAFKRLNLLEIDGDLFQHRQSKSNCQVFYYLLNQIPKFDRAKHIVECLHLNLSRTSYSAITLNASVAILNYLDVYLGLDTPNELFTDKLAEIPIFVSHFNECLAIKGYEKVYVAPSDFPIFGLKDIAKETKTLVLKAIGTDKIFRKLNIQMLTHYEAYRDLIIPHIPHISDESIYKHLEFLANFNKTNSKGIFNLLDLLRTKPLIYIKEMNRRVHVSELFDPDQVIFTSFCTCQELVPERYRTHGLLKFLRSLGLKTKISKDLFLQFATDIYAKSFKGDLTQKLKKKSDLLLKYFFAMGSSFFHSGSFDDFAKIKFIVPNPTDGPLSSIYKFHNEHQLICFEESVLASSIKTCWTVSNILSCQADPTSQCQEYQKELVQKLKICRKPNLKLLITHCVNVCKSVYENPKKLNKNTVELLQSVMGDIYKDLSIYLKSGELGKHNVGELLDMPVILVQKIGKLVLPETIVMSCKDDEEICPFLNKCPDEYIQYKDLFLFLGAIIETSCDSFASVLFSMSQSCGLSKILLPQEKFDAIKATKFFFSYLSQQSEKVKIKDKHCIMLSKRYTLEVSRNLVVKNNSYYQMQLNRVNNSQCMYLIEFENLQETHLKVENCIDSLQFLPPRNRPYLLTDIVCERVVLKNIVDKDSRTACKLEDFIHCRGFTDGFVRLVRHSSRIEGRNWIKDEEIRLLKHLGNVHFRHASGIETFLEIKPIENGELQSAQLIENTNETKSVHLECSKSNVCIYFDSKDDSWLESVKTELAVHLNGIVGKYLKDHNLMQLRQIIGMIDSPEKISWYLSKEKVEEYDSPVDIQETLVYPKPGTFVPRELYIYLDNEYDEIYDYEYKFVALEIEDPALSGSIEIGIDEDANVDADLDPTYIFVHVVKKLESVSEVPLMQEYQINDGTEMNLTVKAYQLYKFIRKPKKYDEGMCTKEMQVMIYSRNAQEEESTDRQQPVSFTDACKEIRMSLNEAWKLPDREKSKIVKRLLLKWHPDKNPENVLFCTKIFQYIQQCIRRLEEGLTLIDNDEENERSDNRSGSPRGKNRYRSNPFQTYWSSSRFGRFWERYEKRRTFYEEENSRSHHESYSGQDTRGATFTMPEEKPFHYYAEAKRWQKQAKSDLHNSAISLQKAPSNSYNWVCYMAHQAAEKSLKAAWYSKDANKIHTVRYSHNLNHLASDLGSDIDTLAGKLVRLTGEHTKMRYPDAVHGQEIPEEVFDRQTAESVLSFAEQIIDIVEIRFIK